MIESQSPFGIGDAILAGFVRVATHPRIFRRPSKTAEAVEFCEQLLAYRRAVLVRPGPRHWNIFASLCRKTQARGNEVPDAWLAALAIEHDCRWITLDQGFARFPDLQIAGPEIKTT
ncbi:MAG TPA: TA system VapC family ribonuclease toxin [Chthoniobacterales bacterium]